MNRKIIVTLLASVLIFNFGAVVRAADFKTPTQLVSEARAAIKEVSIQDLKKMMENNEKIIILDVRDRDEYEKQRIPGSIHMSRGLLDLHVDEIISDKNAKIVVY
ncbi:MAG TPA: rhodanese-like domain-containing protein [Thermodesulfovibrionales bacterium]|nr:rhodanese-like domain-containing protein [Thermodesulfovibrionales bacterium]